MEDNRKPQEGGRERIEISRYFADQHCHNLSGEKEGAERFLILYISKGKLEITLAGSKVVLLCNDLMIFRCPVQGSYCCLSGVTSFWRLTFSKAYLQDALLTLNSDIYSQLSHKDYTGEVLHIYDYKLVKNLFSLMYRNATDVERRNTEDVVRLCFNIALYIIKGGSSVVTATSPEQSGRPSFLITRFLFLVKLHVHQHHTVQFYSDALCITRGHLARVLNENGSRNPKQIIEAALTDAAKRLLEGSGTTIYAIADQLNFSSASSFTSFFKRQTRQTPSEYRSGVPPK